MTPWYERFSTNEDEWNVTKNLLFIVCDTVGFETVIFRKGGCSRIIQLTRLFETKLTTIVSASALTGFYTTTVMTGKENVVQVGAIVFF